MPRRNDIHRILIVGSGPIIIGQACEFDYSGAQACKALRQDGYEVVLINSNPATIMTDPNLADRTYVEPLSLEYATEVIRRERPDALLSTVGGQTGLNLSVALAEAGVLDQYGVELIGAKLDAIKKAEDRLLFKDAMKKIGLDLPQSQLVTTVEKGLEFAARIGYPVILRPSFTMGGSGGGIAYNREDLVEICEHGLDLSPVHEVLIEESVLGWKEFELEVMRDQADNAIIVCSIENFDPMGVHTGDSITVAPAQTLTDREYQMMRDGALECLREIGVDTGGSNVQFAIDPATGRMVIVEMNPRVSRSSALASKATGFPIAKIAAKLAVGYRLDEIKNDITRKTPACFEPTIDYVVVKIPRWQFEKFPGAEPVLGTQMKSVGEAMAIGRTFKQALGKGMRSLETGKADGAVTFQDDLIEPRLITPNPDRLGLHPLRVRARLHRRAGSRAHVDRSVVPAAGARDGRPGAGHGQGHPGVDHARAVPGGQARRHLRFEARPDLESRAAGCAGAAQRAGRHGGVQSRGYVRGRVRKLHAVSVFELRIALRGGAFGSQEGHDSGQRAEPDRAGHRVRLLLLPRVVRAAGVRRRVDHGELQSRDRLDRLRHQRPAVLRAADAGRSSEHLRDREAGWRDRAVRRPDSADAGAAAEARGRADYRDRSDEYRSGGRSQAVRQASRRAEYPGAGKMVRRRRSKARATWRGNWAIRCWCGRATCWAGARW